MASLARSSSTSSLASSTTSSSSSFLARRASTIHRPPPIHASSPPTSPPHSPSRVKMTIHAPHTSPSSNRASWGASGSHALPRRSAPAPSPPSSKAATSGSSTASKTRRRRFDPHCPPRSGWESYMYPISLGVGLGCGMTLFSLLRDPVHMEAREQSGKQGSDEPSSRSSGSSKSPQYSLEQVTLICVVGVPSSGKSSQASRLSKRFEGFRILSDVTSASDLSSRIQEARKADVAQKGSHAETLLIVDGFPRTADEAKAIEQAVCPIFVVTYMDLPKDDFAKRFPQRSVKEEWEPSAKGLQGVVEAFRKRGNILEIAAHWESVDEVWEQVEAKVEQVLELKAMGEDVSVE